MVSFQKPRLQLKIIYNLQPLVEKFTIHYLNAPHKWGIPELKDNYAHVIHSPTESNQVVVECYENLPFPFQYCITIVPLPFCLFVGN